MTTKYAQHFFLGSELPTGVELYDDKDEWSAWSKRGDPVLHIELRKWADIFVIAPLDANTLAKIANVSYVFCSWSVTIIFWLGSTFSLLVADI